jgi:hypothetical protein
MFFRSMCVHKICAVCCRHEAEITVSVQGERRRFVDKLCHVSLQLPKEFDEIIDSEACVRRVIVCCAQDRGDKAWKGNSALTLSVKTAHR